MISWLKHRRGAAAGGASMGVPPTVAGPSVTKGGLLLRDSLIVLILCSITVTLFGVTWLLHKSFQGHREDLARRWSARGQAALEQRHPNQAASDLRTALSYDPDDRADQLRLAQALAESGQTEAATNYFLNLWDVHPGDGFVNLQLARLARQHGDSQEAINYYRASIFGTWEGDGVTRRREVRLELADYLAQHAQIPAAKAELLIAAGNTPEKEETLQIQIADRLQDIGDLPDALHFYQVAAAQDPNSLPALEKAGRAAFDLGNYPEAHRLLTAAAQLARHNPATRAEEEQLTTLADKAHRIPELRLSRDLSASDRADHILVASTIAQNRLKSCGLQLNPPPPPGETGAAAPVPAPSSPVIEALKARWLGDLHSLNRRNLMHDSDLADSVTQLIGDTETQTATLCGNPTGDDALLLRLAASNGATQ